MNVVGAPRLLRLRVLLKRRLSKGMKQDRAARDSVAVWINFPPAAVSPPFP